MKRRNLLLAALLSVTLLTGLVWLVFRTHEPPEPVYQGKRLSEWLSPTRAQERHKAGGHIALERLHLYMVLEETITIDAEAAQAVRQIGTNGIPTLLRMLRAHDSKLKLKLIHLVRIQHLVEINFVEASQLNTEAAVGFKLLGASASNAVPALIQIYEEEISEWSQESTIEAFGAIGPAAKAAVPALLGTVANTNAGAGVRGNAALKLKAIDPKAAAKAGIQ